MWREFTDPKTHTNRTTSCTRELKSECNHLYNVTVLYLILILVEVSMKNIRILFLMLVIMTGYGIRMDGGEPKSPGNADKGRVLNMRRGVCGF